MGKHTKNLVKLAKAIKKLKDIKKENNVETLTTDARPVRS